MAKLTGVKTLSDREIEYGGVRYVETEGPALLDDIVRCNKDLYLDVELGSFYHAINCLGDYVGFYDDNSDVRGIGDGGFAVDYEDFTLFRRVESVPQSYQSLDEIQAAIEEKRAEIAELEAQLEIRVDDYVRVIGHTNNDDFSAGDIAQVSFIDDSDRDGYPYKLRALFGNLYDWASASDVEKVTPAEAKAALIAQIDEAFKSA